MAGTLVGRLRWGMTRNMEGHREYSVTFLVRCSSVFDGPQAAWLTAGLPVVGNIWAQGTDIDPWAFCLPTMRVTEHKGKGEPNEYWEVERIFSTIPMSRCQDEYIEDPLLEPQRVSGDFVKYTRTITHDKDGNLVVMVNHEPFRGLEFDNNEPTVRIEQNVANLGLDVFSEMVDTVNDRELWGLGTRKIKLSNVSWERRVYGVCDYYYTRIFDFDIHFDGFDLLLPHYGSMVRGYWNYAVSPPVWVAAGDAANPQQFVRYKDIHGENSMTYMDATAAPVSDIDDAHTTTIKYYAESNFLLLGIPTVF